MGWFDELFSKPVNPQQQDSTLGVSSPGASLMSADFIPQAWGYLKDHGLVGLPYEQTPIGKLQATSNLPVTEPRRTSAAVEAFGGFGAPVQAEGDAVSQVAKRGYAGLPDIRQMSPADALAEAQTGNHIQWHKDGSLIGGPRNIRSMEDLQAMRDSLDQKIVVGAQPDNLGRTGGTWYPRTQAFNEEISGGDPLRSRIASQGEAVTSPQSNPRTNLGFMLDGANAWWSGTPATVMRTGTNATKFNTALGKMEETLAAEKEAAPTMLGHNGGPPMEEMTADRAASLIDPIATGKKTGVYGNDIDPHYKGDGMGTNDTWQGRLLGYTNPDGGLWDGSINENMHKFMDRENVLAADRANKAKVGGKSDWTPQSIQSSGWITGKGQGLADASGGRLSLQDGLTEANNTYADEAKHFAANFGSEPRPYAQSGGIADTVNAMSPAERDAWAAKNQWLNDKTQHPLLSEMFPFQVNAQTTRGVYTPPGGGSETNLLTTSHPLVRRTPQTADSPRMMNAQDQSSLDTASMLSQMLTQNASVPASRVETAGRTGSLRDVHVELGRAPTDADVTAMHQISQGIPNSYVSNTRNGLLLGMPETETGASTGAALRGDLGDKFQSAFGQRGQRAQLQSNYPTTNFETELHSDNAGKGMVVQRVLDQMHQNEAVNPGSGGKLWDSKAVKQQAADQIDMMHNTGGWQSRADIMKTMKIIAMGGMRGLNEYVAKYGKEGLMGLGGTTAGYLSSGGDPNNR